jgi:hypothetical protein
MEFFDPIPIPAMALAVFALIFGWMLSKSFRMPNSFLSNEAAREDIRFKLFDQEMHEEMENAAAEAAAAASAPAEGADAQSANAQSADAQNAGPKAEPKQG